MIFPMPLIIILIVLVVYFVERGKQSDVVDWASIQNSRGDKIPDFSFCGYHNSEIPLPTVHKAKIMVPPPGHPFDDISAVMQKAIDFIAEGGGGVVHLPPGRSHITAGIQLRTGVVVTGSQGNGTRTTLMIREKPSVPVFTLGSLGNATKPEYGVKSDITDDYVPIGSSIVNVDDASDFKVNQSVYVSRAATEAWIRGNGMSNLVRHGQVQTWIPVDKKIMSPNVVNAIDGNQVTLKIPLTDNLDSTYMKPQLWAYDAPQVNSEMGIKDLSIEVPDTCSGAPLDGDTCNHAAVSFPSWTVDSWASGLSLHGFNNFFEIQQDAARITIQDTTMDRNHDVDGRALPFDILVKGSQVLVQDCKQVGLPTARCFSVATDSLTAGPNAVTRHTTMSDVQMIYPHERWAHGFLVESTSVPNLFVNRASNGSGHGWTINAGVGWNLGGQANFQSPPLGINWCIGCGGKTESVGNGTFLDSGKQVKPQSLFAAQLEARGVDWYTRGDDS
ncbi:hypothetical protein FALBO_579 [Fusarium albosuccineum]|uniref:Pectate lyase superfamily protein domain-containing protein n=1 Tax=Fusarium albosuccineum TaxID=1237068 RepID=A0A8H4LRA8_9HYPO|nr:hypothetical protein FALBO_579 [Fusarium albosuccineum]